MEVSPNCYEFAQLILKNYDVAPKPHKRDHNNDKEAEDTPQPRAPVDPLDKYSLDYSKWYPASPSLIHHIFKEGY